MHQASTTAQREGRSRVDAIDAAKGIGIVAVVVGHIPDPMLGALGKVIFCFHMPLFFFLSGLLHGELKRYAIAQYVRSRLVPYVTFGLLAIASTLVFRYVHRGAVETDTVWLVISSFLKGKPVRGTELWFYPCLLVVELAGLVLLQLKAIARRWLVCLMLAGAGLMLSPWNLLIPWSIDVAFVALPFWLLGAFAKDRDLWTRIAAPLQWWAVMSVACILIYFKAFVLSTSVDMRTGLYGNPVLFYAAAVAGISATLLASKAFCGSRTLTLIGRASFAIYPLHMYFISIGVVLGQFGLAKPAVLALQVISALLGGVLFYQLALRYGVLRYLLSGRYQSWAARA